MAILKYDFRVIGANKVKQAIASIEKRVIASEQRMGRAMGAQPGRRTTRGRSPMAGFAEVGRAARAADMKMHRDRLRMINTEKRAKIRADQTAIRQRERLEQSAHRRTLQAQNKAMAIRQRSRTNFARSTVGVAGRSVRGTVGAIGGAAGGMVALGGGMLVTSAISDEKALRGASRGMANQAFGTPGEKRTRQEINKDVLRQSRQLGVSSGLGRGNIVQGLRSFTEISGNLRGAQQMMPFMADVASATDADIGDVGRTGGQILQSLQKRYDFSDEKQLQEALSETEKIMMSMAGQAKVGAIEFKDLSRNMGALMSATAPFEGKVSDLAATMGAMAQISLAGGAASPEEAMTAVRRFADDMVKNQKRFKEMKGPAQLAGVNVFANKGRTKLRAPEEILFELIGKSEADLTKISKVYGIRAKKAVDPFQGAYTAFGGGEKGMKAMRRLLDTVRNAKETRESLATSAGFRRGGEDVVMAKVMEDFKNKLGQELMPAVTRLIPKFAELLPHLVKVANALAKFIDAFAARPLETVGKVIAAKLVLDIAAAGIGAAVRTALVAAISGTSAGGAAAGALTRGAGGAVAGGALTRGAGGAAAGAALGRGGFMGLAGGLAGAAGIAGLATGLGHMAVGGIDDLLGLEKNRLSTALPGRTKEGGFSAGQLAKDLGSTALGLPGLLASLASGGEFGISKMGETVKGAGEEVYVNQKNQQAPELMARMSDSAVAVDKSFAAINKSAQAAAANLDKIAEADFLNRGDNPSPVKK